ncbi:MAG: hypothetical protein WBV90_12035, partial [Terrimicrobiaceae bacterium]
MYGPQPAGAINFVMKKAPLNTKFKIESTNLVGSFGYFCIIGGVNNIFDRDYYARIRSDGIDPAMPRNWYAGVKVSF